MIRFLKGKARSGASMSKLRRNVEVDPEVKVFFDALPPELRLEILRLIGELTIRKHFNYWEDPPKRPKIDLAKRDGH